MFYGCNSLTSLNISHFDISNANYIDNIRDKFGGSNSFIETLLGQLDE